MNLAEGKRCPPTEDLCVTPETLEFFAGWKRLLYKVNTVEKARYFVFLASSGPADQIRRK